MAGTLNWIQPSVQLQSNYTDTTGGSFYGSGLLRTPGFLAGNAQILSALSAPGNCDLLGFVGAQSITSGTPVAIDLTTTLKQPDGITVANFFSVGGMIARFNGAAGTLTLGGGTNAFAGFFGATGTYIFQPGATIAILNPTPDNYPTSGTSKILSFAISAGTSNFDLIVWGRSAA